MSIMSLTRVGKGISKGFGKAKKLGGRIKQGLSKGSGKLSEKQRRFLFASGAFGVTGGAAVVAQKHKSGVRRRFQARQVIKSQANRAARVSLFLKHGNHNFGNKNRVNRGR